MKTDAEALFDLEGHKLDDYAAAAYREARREDFKDSFATDLSPIDADETSSTILSTPVSILLETRNTY